MLDLVRDRLMQPDAVKTFVAAYMREINAGRDDAEAARGRLQRQLDTVGRKLEGFYDAVGDGLRTPGLLGKIQSLEADKSQLEAELAAPAPSPVRLHPNLAEVYRSQVVALRRSLADPLIHDEALTILRGLIDHVALAHGPDGWQIDLQGEITTLVGLGLAKDKAPRPGSQGGALCSVKVVAGARNHLNLLFAAPRLRATSAP